MKRNAILLSLLLAACGARLSAQSVETNVRHVKVYYEPGKFGGWPANHGIWSWGNEILVGFSQGLHKDLGPNRHNFDREKPELHLLARSLDGGETWAIEDPGKSGNGDLVVPDNGSYHGVLRTDVPLQEPVTIEGIDFGDPDLAFTTRMTNSDGGDSYIWYSYDRGHSWEGPGLLPGLGTQGTAARTDYIIDGPQECTIFLTAAKSNGEEGRLMCARTTDGGKNWSFLSWIGPEPEGFAIMPASVRLSDREILVAARCREASGRFIATYLSEDNGHSWKQLGRAVEGTGEGNPPAMIRLQDGRICLIYGYRAQRADIEAGKATSDIRARLSSDNGRSWSRDYILRNDGSGRDLGYPRVVQRPDGKIVALYYFMDAETGPERYISATIWEPPAAGK